MCVRMRVCVSACACVCPHVRVCVRMCVCVSACACVRPHVRVCIGMCVCVSVCACVRLFMWLLVHMHAFSKLTACTVLEVHPNPLFTNGVNDTVTCVSTEQLTSPVTWTLLTPLANDQMSVSGPFGTQLHLHNLDVKLTPQVFLQCSANISGSAMIANGVVIVGMEGPLHSFRDTHLSQDYCFLPSQSKI